MLHEICVQTFALTNDPHAVIKGISEIQTFLYHDSLDLDQQNWNFF